MADSDHISRDDAVKKIYRKRIEETRNGTSGTLSNCR